MATTTKVINANAVNQGSSIVGVNSSGAYDSASTISKTKSTLDSQYSSRDYSSKFDDYGLRRRTVEIGAWDMDTTAAVEIKHTLINNLWKNVRAIDVVIRNDADTIYYTDSTDTSADADDGFEITKIDEDAVYLARAAAASTFDNTDFNQTAEPSDASIVYNRGWITIWYE